VGVARVADIVTPEVSTGRGLRKDVVEIPRLGVTVHLAVGFLVGEAEIVWIAVAAVVVAAIVAVVVGNVVIVVNVVVGLVPKTQHVVCWKRVSGGEVESGVERVVEIGKWSGEVSGWRL
jgi:hypothetical protein